MARILVDTKELSDIFCQCCRRYNKISFITAWAGNHASIDVLYEQRNKILKSVVGLHFYQTSPNFIEKFLETEEIQYNKRMTTDVFHPKVYLFYNNDSEWTALVGSSNLTGGGFGRNMECNVLMTSTEESTNVFSDLIKTIHGCWSKSEPMGDFFKQYRQLYDESKTRLQPLKKPLNVSVKDISWNDYIEKMITNEGVDGSIESPKIQTRLTLLREAEKLFSEKSLIDFPDKYPWAVAGLISEYKNVTDWQFFGSTNANGKFHKIFNSEKGRKLISEALDDIPLNGEVTKFQFDNYIEKMRNATKLNDIKAIASRFLAMKRPDIFVSINSKNPDILNLLATGRKNIKLDQYWDVIVENIQMSSWYNEDISNIPEAQKEIFKYRAAMLDSLYYSYLIND